MSNTQYGKSFAALDGLSTKFEMQESGAPKHVKQVSAE